MADVVFFGGRMSEELEKQVEKLTQELQPSGWLTYDDLVSFLEGDLSCVRSVEREDEDEYGPDPEGRVDAVAFEFEGHEPIELVLPVQLRWVVEFDRDIAIMTPGLFLWDDYEGVYARLSRDNSKLVLAALGLEPKGFQLPEEVETLPLPEWAQVDWDWGQEDLPPRIISLTCFKSEAMALKAEFIAQLGPTEREDKS